MRFENPYILYLLLGIIPLVAYYIYRLPRAVASVRISSVEGFSDVSKVGGRVWLRHMPVVCRMLALALLVVAMARPQRVDHRQNVNVEGIDIMLALDISSSMLARDFEPNRLEAAKQISSQFVMDRPTDRIGFVIFGGEAFTQSPLTTDHSAVVSLLSGVYCGLLADGTAIGNGLATAVNRLKDSEVPSKVVVLLTDGVNNSGQIDPLSAAQIAKDYGIRVYTIAVGVDGFAPYPVYDAWGQVTMQNTKVEIDEKVLTEIAQATGGAYFRATDNNKLTDIYQQINKLEKAKVEVDNYVQYSYVYHGFALAALVLLLVEFLLRFLVLRRIP